jgi:hypothetical protein
MYSQAPSERHIPSDVAPNGAGLLDAHSTYNDSTRPAGRVVEPGSVGFASMKDFADKFMFVFYGFFGAGLGLLIFMFALGGWSFVFTGQATKPWNGVVAHGRDALTSNQLGGRG